MAQERDFLVAIITRRGPNPETCQFRPYVTEEFLKTVEWHTLLQASMYNYSTSAQ